MIGPFLIKLVEQPEVLGHYLRDPEGAMDAAGLSDSEREILRTGNLRRLRETLQEEYPDREVFLGHIPPIGVFGHVPFCGHVPQVQSPEPPDEAGPGE
jgi:hypothetical protein